MSEDSWRRARLIPASRVEGEPDRRSASVLLAVMAAVREFGRGLTQPLGAPRGTLRTYTDTPFPVAGQDWFPAGLIRVRRDQHTWTALVEVRTGPEPLDPARVRTCLDIAREQGFDAVLTISNETSPGAGLHPVDLGPVDPSLVDASPAEPGPALHHYAWGQLLAEAGMHQETRGVADPDQAWVLGELIRYLEDPGSGVLRFDVVQESMEPVTAPIIRIRASMVDDGKAGEADANPVRPVEPVSIDVSRIDAMPSARSVSLDLPFDRPDSLDRSDPHAPSLEFSDTLESLESLEPLESSESLEPGGSRELPVRSAPPHPSRREIRLVRQLGDRDPAAAAEPPGTPEAGWYQDPGDAGRLRWFDGLAWSECTYPAQPALA